MKNIKKTALGLAIFFNLFLMLFALDIFGEGYGLVELLVGLFMHLIPNMILGLITFLAYKKTLIGGIAFLVLGLIFTVFFHTYREFIVFIMINGPLYLIGGLLILSSKKFQKFKKNKK
jgi:hypothetical protein